MERFPIEAWREIFSKVPGYPVFLPDDLVRQIADLAIHVRNMSEQVERGVAAHDRLVAFMPLSLISGSFKRVQKMVEDLVDDVPQHQPKRADAISHWLAMRVAAAEDAGADVSAEVTAKILAEYNHCAENDVTLPVDTAEARGLVAIVPGD